MLIEHFSDGTPYEEIDAGQLLLGDVMLPWSGEVEITGVWQVVNMAKAPNGLAYKADQVSHKIVMDLRCYGDVHLKQQLAGGAMTPRTMLPTDRIRVYRPEGNY